MSPYLLNAALRTNVRFSKGGQNVTKSSWVLLGIFTTRLSRELVELAVSEKSTALRCFLPVKTQIEDN